MGRVRAHNCVLEFEHDNNEDTEYIGVEVDYTYHPYVGAYTPRGEYAPIDPPELEFAEINKWEVVDEKYKSDDYLKAEIDRWLREDQWVQEELCRHAMELEV